MNELALHILDLVQNSISAGASTIGITIRENTLADQLSIEISDDGCGMDEALLARVTSPFATTRKTRKVGLGIPMFKQCAEQCQGTFQIESTPGKGTRLEAHFQRSHVDLPPMGDLVGTMLTLLNGAPEKPEFCLTVAKDAEEFVLDTKQIREALGGLPLNLPEVVEWIQGYLEEGLAALNG